MDESRKADLKRIDERLSTNKMQVTRDLKTVGLHPVTGRPMQVAVTTEHYNANLDRWGKEQAERAKANIMAQSKDKKLAALRRRLIKASRAHDQKAELQITAQIRNHEGKVHEDYS